MTVRIYLAGPEVFLANAREIGVRKRAICTQYGLTGVCSIIARRGRTAANGCLPSINRAAGSSR